MKNALYAAVLFFVASIFFTGGVIYAQTMSFPDVSSDAWYYSDVMNMVSWDVIRGNDDGTFKPDNNVNRAELSAMWNRYDKHLEEKFALKSEIPTLPSSTLSNEEFSESFSVIIDYVNEVSLDTLQKAVDADAITLQSALDYTNKIGGSVLDKAYEASLDTLDMAYENDDKDFATLTNMILCAAGDASKC